MALYPGGTRAYHAAMALFSRYIARQILVVMAAVTVGLTLAIWLSQSLRFLDIIVNRGLPAGLALYFLALMLPGLLTIVLPLSLFVSVLFVYHRLIADSELVVVRGAGAGNLALARPALVIALGVSALCFFLTAYGMPASMRSFEALERTIHDDYSQILIEPGVFTEATDGVMIFARERSRDGGMEGVIVQDSRNPLARITYTAALGAFVGSGDGPRVVLQDGTYQEANAETGDVSVLYFDRVVVRLPGAKPSGGGASKTVQEQFLGELLTGAPADDSQRSRMRAEGHQRIVMPLYTLVFVLVALAALLYGSVPRFGRGFRLSIAITAVAALQGSGFALQSLTARSPGLVALMYVVPLLAVGAGLVALAAPLRPAMRALPHWPTPRLLSPA